jgi:hypothetical protein
VQARKYEGLKGEEAVKRADQIAFAKLYAHGLDQIRTVFKSTSDASYMGDDYMKRFRNTDAAYIPLEAKGLFGNVNTKDFDEQSTMEFSAPDTKNIVAGLAPVSSVRAVPGGYKKFNSLKLEDKQIALKYLNSISNDALKKKYISGTLTEPELKETNGKIKQFKIDFYGSAKQNVQARPIKDMDAVGLEYVGTKLGDSGEFDASLLTSNAGFLTGSTKIYNENNSESLQLKDVPLSPGDKAVINKEYSPASPYYTISGGDAKYAQTRQLVIKGKDGVVKGIYAIPTVNPNTEQGKINTAIAKNATALYTPNSFTQSHSANHRIKYVPINPNTNNPLSNDEINGMRKAGINMVATYDIYDKHGNLLAKTSTPEAATLKIETLKQ